MGCVIQAGLGQNVARQASIKAGFPIEVPAVTMNVVCGSGLNCGEPGCTDDSRRRCGYRYCRRYGKYVHGSLCDPQGRYGYRMGNATMVDTMVNDALTDAFNQYHMGITAENIAEQWGLTREQLDEFAAWSQQKTVAAQEAGKV